MYFSTYPFRAYLELWQAQRKRPEHLGEPILSFYFFRIFSVICCIVIFLLFQLGFPILAILVDRVWPNLAEIALGIVMFVFIAAGFLLGFLAAKYIDTAILRFELRKPFSLPGA